ncbi:MAG: periplasmic heavy metal sensor [Candidatus Eremiobacterota bacterium]
MALAMGLPAYAQKDPLDEGGGRGRLKLTAAQRQQIKEIRQRYRQSRQPIHTRVKALRLELLELLAQEQPDKGQVNAKVREIMDVQMQLQQSIVDELFEIRGVLTPEQWKALRSRLLDEML